jgi:hypothetical protein
MDGSPLAPLNQGNPHDSEVFLQCCLALAVGAMYSKRWERAERSLSMQFRTPSLDLIPNILKRWFETLFARPPLLTLGSQYFTAQAGAELQDCKKSWADTISRAAQHMLHLS